MLVNKVKSAGNVEIFLQTSVVEIRGEKKVNTVIIKDNLSNEQKELPADGIFIEIGRRADTGLVKDLVDRDEKEQIIVDSRCATSHPGVFAAGDVTDVPYKQIVIAAGQGATAALSAYQYLQLKK